MFFKNTYPAFLWAAFILVLTLSPAPDFPKATWINAYHVDKLIHAVLFGILYFLLIRGFVRQQQLHAVLWSIIIVILYGAVTEILQSIVSTGRSGEFTDWLADCVGTGLAFIAYEFRWKIKKNSA